MLKGEMPVEFPSFYDGVEGAQKSLKRQRAPPEDWHPPMADPRYYWDMLHGYDQFCRDGLTMDARELGKKKRVLAQRGKPVPVDVNNVATSSVGKAPRVMAYIATHAQCGTGVWFPMHGAKGGTAGAMEGFEDWHEPMPLSYKQHVLDFDYYNMPEALASFRALELHKQPVEQVQKVGFRVRISAAVHAIGPRLVAALLPASSAALARLAF
jgi:hypothetical protein